MTRALNGETVKELREALGITQRELAAACDISQGHLSHVERGDFNASPALARKLAAGMGVSLASITYPVPEPAQAQAISPAQPVAV